MTARLFTTVYDPDDLPTEVAHIASKSLGTVNAWTELEYQHPRKGTGSFKGKINRHHSQAALLVAGRYLIFHSDAGPIGGAWLEEAPIDLSAEQGKGDEWAGWQGRGAIAILERGRLLDTHYSTDPAASPFRGNVDNDGVWEWINAVAANIYYGGVLARSVEEGQDEPGNPLAVVSMWGTDGADRRVNDASGNPWTGLAEAFRTDIGNHVLDLAMRFSQFGVITQMSYLFRLDAYNEANFGTDRSGAFGSTTVRLEKGVNIAASIQRKVRGEVARTHLLVGGADHVYETVVHPDYVAGEPAHWGFLSVPETSDSTDLAAIGLDHLRARDSQTDAWVLPLKHHGDDPANGIYEPAPDIADGHFWVGDEISFHTGSGEYDANEQSAPVAAITWQLKTGDEANGDYRVIVEIGSTFHWEAGESFSGGVPGSQTVLRLCQALVGSAPTFESGGFIGTSPTAITVPDGLTNSILVVWGHFRGDGTGPPYTSTYGATTLTAASSVVGDGSPGMQAFYMLNPPADPEADGSLLSVVDSTGNGTYKHYQVWSGVDPADPIGSVLTASGTGTSVAPGAIAGGSGSAFLSAVFGVGSSTADPTALSGQTVVGPFHDGLATVEMASGYGTATQSWTLSASESWLSIGLALNGTASNSGRHPDLTGTDPDAARCDHGHVAHETGTPGVSDDSTAGFVRGDFWAVVDDATTPTEITAVYELFDATEGAAVWLELPSGGVTDHGALTGLTDDDHPQYIKDSEFTAVGDILRGTGAGTFAAVKNNLAATAAPTVNDDSGDGYSIGSSWLDTTNDKEYVALDVTLGAAVWKERTNAAGGGTTITVEEVDGSPTGAIDKLVLPNGTLGIVGSTATYTPAGGGGGVDWSADVNEPGASFVNFTANTGTWSSTGTVIQQTNAGGAHMRARYNTKLPLGLPTIVECELKVVSGGNNVGFLVGYDGAAGGGGIGVSLNDGTNVIQVENGAIGILDTIATTITTGTFYKVRALINGPWVTIYVDGTLLGTVAGTNPGNDGFYVGLWTWTAAGEFRNFKVWTLSTGLPA